VSITADIAERNPLVSDRMILQLTNDIVVAEDLGQRQRTVVGRMLDQITGKGDRATALSIQALADSERILMAWITDVAQTSAITNLTLARVTEHVTHTRRGLAEVTAAQQGLAEEVGMLTRVLKNVLAEVDDRFMQVGMRLDELERRLNIAELKQEARDRYEDSVEAWEQGRAYAELPWACQVMLLAREVASGPYGLLERATGEQGYRDRLANRILARRNFPQAVSRPFVVPQLCENAAAELETPERVMLVAELLESGLASSLAMPTGPLTWLLRTTLELSTSYDESQARLGAEALRLTREQYGWLDATADREVFVRRAVTEHADSAQQLRLQLSGRPDE
jgi:hypothetical protein